MKSTPMTDELKPCPFCGSYARLFSWKRGKARHVIGCINIECVIYLPNDITWKNRANYVSGAWVDVVELKKAWNRRAL